FTVPGAADKSLHFRKRSRLPIGVVKQESLPRDLEPLEAQPCVRFQGSWVFVPSLMKEKGSDAIDTLSVQVVSTLHITPGDVYHTDDNRCQPWPFLATGCMVNDTFMSADVPQPAGTCISLCDRVGCNQPHRPMLTQQLKNPAKEVADKVHSVAALFV